jgi:ABC-2 type transport system permease protein
MSTTSIITRREFRSNFDTPVGYVVLSLALIFVGFLTFQNFWTVNRASIAQLFFWLGWALAFTIPAVTMRLFAEEKRTGTIELLITMPVRDREVVLAKFLATLGLVAVMLILTLTYPITIGKLGSLDWGPVGVGYLGLLLEATAMIAVGLFFSSITENQVIALFSTLVTLVLLNLLDFLGNATGGWLGDLIASVSFQHRLTPFTRGLLDLRNVVFFVSVAWFFLLLTMRSLESRKWK